MIRGRLLRFGYKPLFDIPEEWWKDRSTRHALLKERIGPPSKKPGKLTKVREIRRVLRLGHGLEDRTPLDPYSSEECASESEFEPDPSVENTPEEDLDEEPSTSKPQPLEDELLPGADSLLEAVASPQDSLPPQLVVTVSDTQVGVTENGQDVSSAGATVAGHGRRRGFRNSIKNMFRR